MKNNDENLIMDQNKRSKFFSLKPFNKENLLKILCYGSVISFVIFLLVSLILGLTTNIDATIIGNKVFSDFAETISYCIVKNPYDGYGINSIYPPFAFLPFYLFALMCKGNLSLYIAGDLSLIELCKKGSYIISFILYYLINIALILLIGAKMSKEKGKNLIYLLVSIFCFGPLLYAFGRGNVIITALLFTLLFFLLEKSEVRWKKEIANLCLACAIAIKIYPAILLLYFLKDRRFLDLLKTLVYALILLFIPFLLIDGGFNNIKLIWNNFTSFSGEGREMHFGNISLDSLCSKFALLISYMLGGISCDGLYSILTKFTRYGLLLSAIVVPLFSKKSQLKMQVSLLAIITYELFQGVSYGYTMIFIIIPLIQYIEEFATMSKFNKWYYGICFALIACPLFYIIRFLILQGLVLVALVTKAIVDLIKDDVRIKKESKAVI